MTNPVETINGVKRRDFLKVLGVTGAATTMVGCSTGEVEKLIPYVSSPDNTVPGVSSYYATTCRECAAGCGVIVETRDGRAIKAEGNPDHPVNRGAICARGQAALQGLYHPDRFRGPLMRQNGQLVPISWDQAIDALHKGVDTAMKGGKVQNAVFINQHEQGLLHTFLDAWLANRGMPKHISYDAEAPFATIAANKAVYGVAWPKLDFGAAKLIVSFAADFLDGWGLPVPQQLDFADARGKIEGAPNINWIRSSIVSISDSLRPLPELSLLHLVEPFSASTATFSEPTQTRSPLASGSSKYSKAESRRARRSRELRRGTFATLLVAVAALFAQTGTKSESSSSEESSTSPSPREGPPCGSTPSLRGTWEMLESRL